MSFRRLDVFLSSTGKDLAAHRQAILKHLAACDAFHCVASETFGARSRDAVETCRERVRSCQVIVGLIGHYRGWEPDGDANNRSITEMEYDWAIEHDLEPLMYVAPDGLADAPDLDMTADARARQSVFRQRVLDSNLHDIRFYTGHFATPGDLAAAVAVGLQNLLQGRMLKRIRELEAAGQTPPPAPSDPGAAPDAMAALAALSRDPDLDALLADPKDFDIRKLEDAVVARATQRREAQSARQEADAKIKAAASDYRRLAALNYGIDAARAHQFYALAAETDPGDGMTLYWLARTAREGHTIGDAREVLARACPTLDDTVDGRGAFWAHIGLGDLETAAGRLSAATEAFRIALGIATHTTRLDPANAGWQRDLSVSHNKIGDVLRDQGNLSDALASYRASLAIRDRLAKSDPGNAGWQRDLSVSHDRIGDVLRDQGNLSDALASYRASLAIRDRLAKSDPGNADWQRDLSVSHNKIGDVLRDQGNLSDALASYRAALAIADRLDTADPGNAEWQRDLSVSHSKIGGVLRAQGNLAEALDAFNASLRIAERLAQSDPGNAGWQRDLSVSHNKIGDVLVAQGNLSDALASYRASHAIFDRLATADPGNAGWQADLAASHGKLGQLHVRLGNTTEALRLFKAGRAIVAPLAERSGHQLWTQYVASFDRNIAPLEGP